MPDGLAATLLGDASVVFMQGIWRGLGPLQVGRLACIQTWTCWHDDVGVDETNGLVPLDPKS